MVMLPANCVGLMDAFAGVVDAMDRDNSTGVGVIKRLANLRMKGAEACSGVGDMKIGAGVMVPKVELL